ncbi:hypothetical protein K491DRAFT_291871 [Lophiostoma macrostomum CBS 122681]|uniref:Uncharacterized protein n=1 Tax=Lophiostoma macrostomum CBS 122681 TaxID=1314788 RepID=A0A6A6SJC8_9PLEO|nr:hypothetical protein K491DRAFT_291871 [Lophiostoma macrostomum CBS 122681]
MYQCPILLSAPRPRLTPLHCQRLFGFTLALFTSPSISNSSFGFPFENGAKKSECASAEPSLGADTSLPQIMSRPIQFCRIGDLAAQSLQWPCWYLGLARVSVMESSMWLSDDLSREGR